MHKILKLTLFVFISVPFIQCSDDGDPEKNNCKPLRLVEYLDTISYIRGKDGRFVQMDIKRKHLTKTYKLEYNSKGKVESIEHFWIIDGSESSRELYKLKYDGDLPISLDYWDYGGRAEPAKRRVDFLYDSKSRLVRKTVFVFDGEWGSTRYSYDENDNVKEVYYTNSFDGERLAVENLSFDNKFRFFSADEALKTMEYFVFDYIPSKNNVLSKVIYMPNPYTSTTPAVQATFTYKYNDRGWVTSMSEKSSSGIHGGGETTFMLMEYDCDR